MLYLVTLASNYTAFYCQKVEFDDEKKELILYKPDIPSPYDFGYVALHIPLTEVVKIEVVTD